MAECCRSEAFVSLATNDFYAKGALALGKSIRDSGSGRQLALVITSGVSQHMKEALSSIWDELVLVEEMDSGDAERLAVLNRPELGVTFTKLAVWTLVRYSKCVYLDADTLVLANVDELFQRDELSAAPDIGWPDCFNSGVFVFRPSMETFRSLVELARQTGSFDGGDQGLLNQFWEDWATSDISFHLPFIYNMTANPSYGYAPAFLKYKEKVKIVHFIGSVKPWQHRYLSDLDTVILLPGTYSSQNVNQDFIHRWWQVYSSLAIDTQTTMDAAAIGEKFSQPEEGKYSHRREFEAGIVDYYGKDSFNNIFTFMKEQMGDMGGDLEVRGDGGSVDNESLKSTSASSLKSKGSSTWSKEEEGLDAEQGKSQTSGDGKFSRPVQSVASGTQSAGGSSGSSLLDRYAKPSVSSESEPTTTPSSTDKAPVEESSPAEMDKCPVASRELSRKEPQADESTEVEASPSPKKSQPLPEVQEESSATADKNRMTEKTAPSTSSSKSSEKQAAMKTASIELFSKPK